GVGGDGEDLALRPGQRVGDGAGLAGDRQPEPADVVALVVVAVPAAVVLGEVERQDRAAGEDDRPRGREDRLARLVATPRPDVDAPGRLVPAVEGERDRPGHAPLPALVVEDGVERLLGRVDVGGGARELDAGRLPRRVGRGGLHLELGQRGGPLDRTPGAAQRQVGVVEQLQAERQDRRYV